MSAAYWATTACPAHSTITSHSAIASPRGIWRTGQSTTGRLSTTPTISMPSRAPAASSPTTADPMAPLPMTATRAVVTLACVCSPTTLTS